MLDCGSKTDTTTTLCNRSASSSEVGRPFEATTGAAAFFAGAVGLWARVAVFGVAVAFEVGRDAAG